MMGAELRRVNDMVVLWTDDRAIVERFRQWPQPRRRVPYRQGHKLVAMDLYFDLGLENTVKSIVNGQLVLDLEYQTT
ncbi:MAG: hypothetical protein HY670_03560 [Chloroflexi bacterium]|nr:hypothetical protein [Chloroflexota bacterium]